MVEGCAVCVKYLLFLFNIIIFVFGIALLALGIYIHVQLGDYTELVDGVPYLTAATFFMIVGVCVVLIAFFGCCGAVKESSCMLGIFFLILFVVFICEIAGGIMTFVYKDTVKSDVIDEMYSSMKNYDKSSSIANAWDLLQEKMECCGTNSTLNWEDLGFTDVDSCCLDEFEGCFADENELYADTCFSILYGLIQEKLLIIGFVGLSIAFIQLINMIFACCLWREIRNQGQLA